MWQAEVQDAILAMKAEAERLGLKRGAGFVFVTIGALCEIDGFSIETEPLFASTGEDALLQTVARASNWLISERENLLTGDALSEIYLA